MTAKASETGTAAGAYAPPAAASGSPDGTPVSLRNLTRAFGATMADRVGVMSNGKLEQVAEPAELYTRPATAFVAEFVGTMNRLPASVAGPGTVTVLGTSCAAIADIPTSGPVDGLVRPEGLTVAPASGGNGIVSGRTFLGAVTRLAVLLSGDTEVRVDLQGCYADLDGLLSTLAVLRRRQ